MPRIYDAQTSIQKTDRIIGTVFDNRFKVEERIAAGGFGAIYRAKHVKSGHDIALKVLLPELAQDLGVVARFRREGAALTALRNPHTIAAYELGQASDRTLFIVMELLHGTSLFERYRTNGPFEWKRMIKIAREICESLAEAHALGIIHRDLKPTNIHLERVGDDPDYVKVLDFGIAKILRGSDFDATDITNAGQMIGTLDYMSPEQMVGAPVTGQTDIYTLGIVMYEMIAGTTPFPESLTAAAALNAMLKTKPDPLYLRAPVPEDLDRVVMRCLERETHKRFRTVTELSEALARLLGPAHIDKTKTVAMKPAGEDTTAITPPPVMRWDSDDEDDEEHAPTGSRRPAPKSPPAASADDEALTRPAPPPQRPLPRQDTPVPSLVAAPFSTRRVASVPPPLARPPTIPPDPLPSPVPGHQHLMTPSSPHIQQSTPLPMLPQPPPMFHGPSSPYMVPSLPTPAPTPPNRPSYEMGELAKREATIRRIVWLIVLVVAASVGIALAAML